MAKPPGICLTKPLPSCEVSRELLGAIERYLRERTDGLFPNQAVARAVIVSLSGPKGDTTQPDIAAHQDQPLPDDTRAITLHCNTGRIESPQITVRFERGKRHSLASVLFGDSSLQLQADSILAGIVNIARSYRTRNQFYHSGGVWALFALLWVAAVALQWPHLKVHVWARTLIGLTATYAALSYLKPFTTFATKQNEKRKEWAGRLQTAAAIVVFAVIAYQVAIKPLVE